MDKSGETAADSGRIKENASELVFFGEVGEISVFFRDSDEVLSGIRDAAHSHLLQEIQKQHVAFDFLPGLARDDEEGALEIEIGFDGTHRGRVGTVQNENTFPALGKVEMGNRFRG